MDSIDPQLERQVETIRNLVESYYGIVSKTITDVVPKTIMHTMVNRLKDYMKGDLLPMIYSAGNQDDMMEESQEAARRRDEMVRMYHTCKDALGLISDVSTKTGENWERGCGVAYDTEAISLSCSKKYVLKPQLYFDIFNKGVAKTLILLYV